MNGNTFTPGPTQNTVRAADGRILTAPEGWVLLPPGDAALPDAGRRPRLSTSRISTERSWRSWPFMEITLISPTGWPVL